jgi:hypothetical protein
VARVAKTLAKMPAKTLEKKPAEELARTLPQWSAA